MFTKEFNKFNHEQNIYPCTLCDYQVTTQGNLTKHKKSVHQGVRYPCTICGRKVTDLSQHIRLHHKGEKYQYIILVARNIKLQLVSHNLYIKV